MFLALQVIIIVLAFTSLEHGAIADDQPEYASIVLPVNKHTDASKPLYSAHIRKPYDNMQYFDVHLLIDIDAPFIWYKCILQLDFYPGRCPANTLCASPSSCHDYQCTEVRSSYSYKNPSCPPVTNTSRLPGSEYCTCPVNVVNPITGSCGQALLNDGGFTVRPSEGNVLSGYYGAYPSAACAPSSSFKSFPTNVNGVMALSSSPYALPGYLYKPLKRIFGLCLPNTLSKPGILCYGNSPPYLIPQSDVDVASFLSFTPLIRHPHSFGYFIRVNSIVIKKRSITIPLKATTKISTIVPYTILRRDIYSHVVRRFSKVTKRIPPAKQVQPFGLCFRTTINGTQVGLKVPDIDFSLPDGKKWSISKANSIKQITKDVACLAFVDGGATSEPAIVIGTFQMENNFLVFDLENSTFGFSSSLLRKRTSCANLSPSSIIKEVAQKGVLTWEGMLVYL